METQKRVSKSVVLSAAVSFLIIIIYGTVRAGPGFWDLNEERPNGFSSIAQAFQLSASRQQNNRPGFGSWFDGCKSVYLDGGSNVGIQIRKIFEPELYPDDPVLPIYDRLFGKNRSTDSKMCVVGFEPNPHHTVKLQELEAAYNKKGWRVKIFTETAISLQDGTAEFYFDTLASPAQHEWGASMLAWQYDMAASKEAGADDTNGKTTVHTIDLAKYVLENVAPRRMSSGASADMGRASDGVLLKVDVEGSEHELFPHLIITGALCQVGAVFYEEHYWGHVSIGNEKDTAFTAFFEGFARDYDSKSCPTTFLSVDNESYGSSDFPLPVFLRNLLRQGL